ncbi:hypothetical protein MZM54_05095 [[Brevibacterium] frigoritolerans]|nr:hypothetical protein [Peribacillus frigoritolerans]
MVNINLASLGVSFVSPRDVSYLEEMLIDSEGELRVLPYQELKDIPQIDLSIFCVKNGYYSIPTRELIDFLKNEIGESIENTLEIGAGNGVYSRELGIKATDNLMQLIPEVRAHYEARKQAIVPYGENVEKLDALQAVEKYKPEIVLAAWVTHKYNPLQHKRGGNELGINEKALIKKVKKYIHIGNDSVHDKKPISEMKHRKIQEPWILSRSQRSSENYIYIWEN